ncbi:MAG: glucose 1-dehydrogenase [Phycisphaerae bacterium]|nr:glucose 1-dehydrogenase [Phycisphaerae bacterium]
MKRFDLTGKVALITGGSRGIGAAISLALAEAGADIAVLFRSRRPEAERIRHLSADMGRRCELIQYDLADLDGLESVVDDVVQRLGHLDVLVNNAGIAHLLPFDKVTHDVMDRTLRVNTMAPFFLAQAAARRMINRHQGGRIINISSTNGIVAEALLAPYNASKGALELITKSLAIELGPHAITVNSVAPGLIETEIGEGFELDPDFERYAIEHIPLGRYGSPEEIAGAVVFLASKAGKYTTGQCIVIDGGLTCDQFPRLQFAKKN